jgi:hypothetical protein
MDHPAHREVGDDKLVADARSFGRFTRRQGWRLSLLA